MGRILRDKGKARERNNPSPARRDTNGNGPDPHLDKSKDDDDASIAGEEDPGSAEDTLYRRPGKDQLAARL